MKKGESGIITVTFKSKGKSNRQHKNITVNTNDPKNQIIYLKMEGFVKAPE
ncbi:MAG: hypothetical protein B7C24_02565 [Bacteroidetes bacterium 4572_77]|nr:MAG: hypothetical protein B7C24_02565 [Bacteroidetes bacterium 4572_77]